MFILEQFPLHRFAVVTGHCHWGIVYLLNVYFSKKNCTQTTAPSSPFPLYVEFTTMFYFIMN